MSVVLARADGFRYQNRAQPTEGYWFGNQWSGQQVRPASAAPPKWRARVSYVGLEEPSGGRQCPAGIESVHKSSNW